jgi:hypothetical protein
LTNCAKSIIKLQMSSSFSFPSKRVILDSCLKQEHMMEIVGDMTQED